MRVLYALFIFLVVCSQPGLGQNNPIGNERSICIDNANALLDEALALMQQHYYKKDSVQWEPLIKKARTLLDQSSDCESAYEAVDWCFDQLKEEHSFIMSPIKASIYSGNVNGPKIPTSSKALHGAIIHELIEDDIGYMKVPWIATTNETICTGYADSLQSIIKSFDQRDINKWIIDLRTNTGGNCWPMLAGLGPLLGNGTHAYFVSSSENIPVRYHNGTVMQGRNSRCTVSTPYTLKSDEKTIIVLVGKNTSSAGEIVALSFKGQPNVYLYGQPTAGLTTANATYSLSNGSMLVLTVCKEADRHGKIIQGKIEPDQLIHSSASSAKDVVKDSAVMFLQAN
ncbi:MAG TPA: S41 family peptidase [Flavitalea sp.]|nr:S41 family peptidase [Flavitalea sp.]